MIRCFVPIVCLGLMLAARAAEPESFAWVWSLNPPSDQPLWRVPLTDEVMRSLHLTDAGDLMITDSEGTIIPYQRLPERLLTETLSRRENLSLIASAVDAGQAERPGLELELTHRDTRLVVHPPAIEPRLGDRDWLVFEALIGGMTEPPEMHRHRLQLDFLSPSDPRLDCRLRAADDEGPASQRVVLTEFGDSRPRRFRGSVEIDTLPRAWHLACYGRAPVPELDLSAAWLVSSGQRQYRAVRQITPTLDPDRQASGTFDFTLDGPYLTRALKLNARQPNLVSSVTVLSRNTVDEAWQPRGRLNLSTLPGAPRAELDLDTGPRHRFWRLVSEPPLRQSPDLTIEAPIEELVFLAQGPPPWKLFAGSREAVRPTAGISVLDDAVSALGSAWGWPRLEPGTRAEAAGPAALETPPEPVDWRRYGLWIVLILGALLVAGLALSLLSSRGERN